MTYLAPLRPHFAGQFQAAPSTVNNDPTHYDNATFKREYQLPGNTRGWWNPRGNADWRLIGCSVTGAHRADGTATPDDDPVRGMLVTDSDRQVPAKLADLDSAQQLCSVIFGLEVRLAAANGATLLRGRFRPAGFIDIWNRAQGPGAQGDIGACAAYQSVLTDLEWGDVSKSPFLTELRSAAGDGGLSIRFNVDGYNLNAASPHFTRGRIVGTIGTASADEPEQFVLGRQFVPAPANAPGFFTPVGAINFCTAAVDTAGSQVLLGLGNALPTVAPAGAQEDLQSALAAIEMIVEQGEGTTQAATDEEGGLAHYYRFAEIVRGRRLVAIPSAPADAPPDQRYVYRGDPIPFDPAGVRSLTVDPTSASYAAGTQAGLANDNFNYAYTSLLTSLHTTFNGSPDTLITAIGLMESCKEQALDMGKVPVSSPAGEVAGPSFQYQPTNP
jgi:Ferritin-like